MLFCNHPILPPQSLPPPPLLLLLLLMLDAAFNFNFLSYVFLIQYGQKEEIFPSSPSLYRSGTPFFSSPAVKSETREKFIFGRNNLSPSSIIFKYMVKIKIKWCEMTVGYCKHMLLNTYTVLLPIQTCKKCRIIWLFQVLSESLSFQDVLAGYIVRRTAVTFSLGSCCPVNLHIMLSSESSHLSASVCTWEVNTQINLQQNI